MEIQYLTEDLTFLGILSVHVDDFLNSHDHVEPQNKWELLKIEIKNCAIKYSSKKNTQNKDRQSILESEIESLTKKLIDNPKSEQLNKQLLQSRQELELIHINKAKGAQLRSRIKWIEEGEKNTKYFLGLEKSRGKANTTTELKKENQSIKNPLKILNEIKSYYSELYTKNTNITNTDQKLETFLGNIDHPVLSRENKELCDSDITINEMGLALSKLNNDSAPGCDGIPVSLYKVMWRQLKKPLFESINASLAAGKLSVTQKRGVVTLLHKGDELDRNNMGNWRPITLTNCDYKIYSKLIALRIQKVIATIIHNSQKGYIKGRSISDSIRIIDDFINISNQTDTPGLLVSVDFQKAFDSVEKSAIISTLKRFNFGETFINYIKVLLEDTYGCVRNGGWLSPWFETQRGVKQGCCTSPYLFILVAELMSIKLRNDNNVNNIDTPAFNYENIINILLYADDTTLFVKNEEALKAAFKIIDELGSFTGLKLNRKKSLILPVGGYKRKDNNESEFTWIRQGEFIKILGVYFSSSKEASLIEKNWVPKIDKVKRMIKQWHKRHLSEYGKIVVAKTFFLSQFTYILQALALPEHILIEIDKLIFGFIWQKKHSNKRAIDKIKRSVLCQEHKDGGLKMISIKDQQKVFLLNWFKKLTPEQNNIFSNLTKFYLGSLGGIPYLTRVTMTGVEHLALRKNVGSHFWKRFVSAWWDFNASHRKSDGDMSIPDILSQPIFMNPSIRYKRKTLFIERWIKKGILCIHDIFTINGFSSAIMIAEKTNTTPMNEMFNHNAVINAIPQAWKTKLENMNIEVLNTFRQNEGQLPKHTKVVVDGSNRDLRLHLAKSKKEQPACINSWRLHAGVDINPFFSIIDHTKESKLKMLHYKIIHNIYPTNISLFKMKLKNTRNCETCQVLDSLSHFFVKCRLVTRFWDHVLAWIYRKWNVRLKLSTIDILLGILSSKHPEITLIKVRAINECILLGKMCISKMKYGNRQDINLLFDMEISMRKHMQ